MYSLGKESHFKDLPKKVYIKTEEYFVIHDNGKYRLLSSICPHQAGKIVFNENENCFKCVVHNWTFEVDGSGKNIKEKSMTEYPIEVLDGELYVSLNNDITVEAKAEQPSTGLFPKLTLHSHACLEIKLDNFTLICDPWLEGNAFLGAWIHFPSPVSKVSDLKVDAIWISHEHSDHFHEPTLRKFDKHIPVYVPHFPNRRMEHKLEKLGFTNINSVKFGEPVRLAEHFTITTYEPASLWNDALVLIEAGDFSILNLNDTGINRAIAKKIGKVDMIASSFSPGASGYPLTWSHLSDDQKQHIMKNGAVGMLKMIQQSLDLYGAKYFLPFASYFSLWHDQHKKYIDLMVKNTLNDVLDYFEGTNIKVIDLLPGDSWDIVTKTFNKKEHPSNLYEKDYLLQYIQSNDFSFAYMEIAPPIKTINRTEIEEYFIKLNDVPEMIFCEDVTVQVNAKLDSEVITVFFEVYQGILKIVSNIETPNLVINMPGHLLKYLIDENESWDEPIIGYWCEFNRNPDVYHADFWRLLQAPYYKKNMRIVGNDSQSIISKESNIAKTLETYGDDAERILSRYGLYCSACQYAPYENIQNAAAIHGLTDEKITRLVKELNRSLN